MAKNRNSKCECGSGLKYKKCCIANDLFDLVKAENILTFTDVPKENRGNLTSFGAFYKENTPHGFKVTFSKKGSSAESAGIPLDSKIFNGLYDNITKCNQGAYNEIKNGCDKEKLIKDFKEQIYFFLPIFWKKFFNSREYPGKGFHQVDIDLTEKIPNSSGNTMGSALMLFISNVMVLTEIGAIQNDNFNGPNLTYHNKEK